MSILLDSLRKSEAQRKFGDTPSIHSTQQYGSGRSSPKQWIAVLMIIVAASGVTWFGWRQYADPDRLASSQAPEVALSDSESREIDPPTEDATLDREPSGEEAGTPVERLSQAPGPADSNSDLVDAQTTEDGSDPVPVDRIAGFVAEDESDPLEIDLEAQEMASSMEDQMAVVDGAEPDANEDFAPVKDVTPARRKRVEPPDSEPLTYWQLPQSLRGDMPEFKISVLVYADAPADRFILINGERLKEQEELESGVVLQEIRRDGAVFSYRNYRFLVKS